MAVACGGISFLVFWRAITLGRSNWHVVIAATVLLTTAAYSVVTVRLIGHWQDSGALWSRQIAFQPIGRAFNARGYFYMQAGSYAGAVQDFTAAIDIVNGRREMSADNIIAFRGEALRKLGRNEEALSDFSAAIRLYPHRSYYYHRALSLEAPGKVEEARLDFSVAGDETGPMEWFADEK